MGAISDKTLGSDCLKLHLMLKKQSKYAEQCNMVSRIMQRV